MYRLTHKVTASFATWVAITAVVLNVLWPLIYQLQPGTTSIEMDICAQSNMSHQDEAGGRAPNQPLPLMPHCAFCTLVGGGFAALVTAPVTPPLLSIDTEVSRLSLPAVRPLGFFRYPPAHPRAPPASLS